MKTFDDFKRYHNSNYHDGDSHFDERTYKKSNGDDFDCSFVQDCYDHFEAGAASRQAEVDGLQKKIDEVTKMLELIKADSLRPSHHDYDKGWRDCAITVLNDLKGA